MKTRIIIIVLLWPGLIFGQNPFKVKDIFLELETVSGKTRTLKRFETRRNNKEYKQGEFNLGLETLAEFKPLDVYFNLGVDSEFTNRQFRSVELNTETGLTFDKFIDVYHRHRSEHGIDMKFNKNYEQDNVIGVRIHFGGAK